MKIPKRIASVLIHALKGGVVPRVGLGYVAVGRDAEIDALLHDVAIAEDGGAFFRFVVGKYGSGKSFLIQTMRQHIMDRGFAVADADLSPERRLMGTQGQGLATYRELMKSLSVKASPDGGALTLILEKWVRAVRAEVEESTGMKQYNKFFDIQVGRTIKQKIAGLSDMVHGFDFAEVLAEFHRCYSELDDDGAARAVRWLRGEYSSKTEARQAVGVNAVINDANWYDYIKLMSAFLVSAGYKGFVVMIDELVNIMKIPNSTTRQNNYEKILTMYNDCMQGKASHLGIIMCGTPQCIEDTRRGVFSYDALRSRLEGGRFATGELRDMRAPIIRLEPLTYEELTVLTEKLAEIHGFLYEYEPRATLEDRLAFVKAEFGRVGANTNITPREMIRDFIELLNVAYDHPDMPLPEIMGLEDFQFIEPGDEETFKKNTFDGSDAFEDFDL